ncbi:MAG: pyridoxal phosphate-dependent aminotransferase [Planctomycetota bacterium]
MSDAALPRIVASVPATGVLAAMQAAAARGFAAGDPAWVNFGQGQPELDPLPGGGPRPASVPLDTSVEGYGPVPGLPALREAVAALVNHRFRAGKAPYRAAHVAVAGGGRAALSRLFAALGPGRVGHGSPDYPAIAEGLARHAAHLVPVHLEGTPEAGFLPRVERLEQAFADGLDAFVASHPNNPTAAMWSRADLARIVAAARRHGTLLVLDEFYGTYVYGEDGDDRSISGLEHVVDPDRDPVVIVDGLTKSLRHPGWRLAWMVGPPAVVEVVSRIGGAMDGGANAPLQRAALDALAPAAADAEARVVRAVFRAKRDRLVGGLEALGLRVAPARGAFYVFCDLSGLPAPLSDADAFFEAALAERVITVPGRLFDMDPAHARTGPSPLASWLRFSYGPPMSVVEEGLSRLSRVVAAVRAR